MIARARSGPERRARAGKLPSGSMGAMRRGATGLLVLLATLAVAGAADARKLEYGVVPQNGALPSEADLDLMPNAGITGLRTMLPWGEVEKSPGVYDWRVTDSIIRELTDRGITPL